MSAFLRSAAPIIIIGVIISCLALGLIADDANRRAEAIAAQGKCR